MSNLVEFPGEFITAQQREMGRWVSLAFGAVVMAQYPDHQLFWLRQMLAKFRDVPDEQPDPNDVARYAAYTVKTLLEVLTDDDPRIREAAEATGKAFWDAITQPAPPP